MIQDVAAIKDECRLDHILHKVSAICQDGFISSCYFWSDLCCTITAALLA